MGKNKGPELMGVAEIAKSLGVSRQRISKLAKGETGFPAPIQRLASGPVWLKSEIEAYIQEREQGRIKG